MRSRRLASVVTCSALSLAFVPALEAQEPTRATPEDVGLSSVALENIGPAMQTLVDSGRTGGIMTLVARHGKVVHWEAHGWRVLGEDPLAPNDIFRIYSMTKPVIGVATMMLVEDGQVSLDDEVADYIPSFADVRVYQAEGGNRPPTRAITILDLLTHTSGLTYGEFGQTAVDSIYTAAGIPFDLEGDLAANVDLIASLPLLADPGVDWNYSVAFDVLGRVIEVVSGLPLDEFLQDRLLEPLGMIDTGFQVPSDKLDRLTAMYTPGDSGLEVMDSPTDGEFTRPLIWLAGGHGLTSTASDYLRFALMLLNEGELDGVRILEPETVRSIRRNHLADELIPIDFIPDHGFGLGVAVAVGERPDLYWWLGVANTYFWIDPHEDLIGFAWTQFQPAATQPIDRILRSIVYEAILDGN